MIFSEHILEHFINELEKLRERYPSSRKNLKQLIEEKGEDIEEIIKISSSCMVNEEVQKKIENLERIEKESFQIPFSQYHVSLKGYLRVRGTQDYLERVSKVEQVYGIGNYTTTSLLPQEKREYAEKARREQKQL